MKITWKSYSILGIIIILSALGVWLLPISDFIKGIYALPGAASLVLSLFQLLRDQSQYEKEIEMQRKQQFFNLSVTSHMAQVAFDKHVQFCEAYIKEVRKIIDAYNMHGPIVGSAVDHSHKLRTLRLEFEPWITAKITEKLVEFEQGLKKLSLYYDNYNEAPDQERKRKVFTKAYEIFNIIIGDVDDESSPDKIIEHLRNILGIEELTALRQAVMREASKIL
jgi:hypothetical protein